MKLYNKLKTWTGVAMVSTCFLTASCDFLDIVPPEQATLNDATKDANYTLNFLYSCYSKIWNPLYPNTTDEYAFPRGWGGQHRTVSYGLYTPTNLADDARWRDFYQAINQTNLFIRELENAKGCTETQIEQWKAEAYFLLAYYHYELLQYFGPIPIQDTYLDTNTSADEFRGRMHYDYVVDWIVETLQKKVIECRFMPITREADERGRATTVIAQALKARVLVYAASPLWNGEFPYQSWRNKVETPGYGNELVSAVRNDDKWRRAKTACEEALTAAKDAGFKLYDDIEYPIETQKIKDNLLPFIPGLADPDSEEGKEFRKRVLMLRNMVTLKVREGNTELIWGVAKDAGTMTYIMPRCLVKNNNNSWFNGQSAIAPTLYSVEHFYTKDGLLPKDASNAGIFPSQSEWLTRAGISGRQDLIKINTNREPRYYAWIAFDQGDYGTMIAEGAPKRLEMKNGNDGGQGYNTSDGASNYSETGFLSQKWIRVDQSRSTNNAWSNSDVNRFARPIIRMAELYLNLAECQAALKDNAALDNLNEIRRRAGVRDLTTADLQTMSLMDWVRNERFVELWGEGHRWNDVRRWKLGHECFGEGKREGLNAIQTNPSFENFNTRTTISQAYRWYNRMYIAPLQYNETQRNTKLVQAPGY